MSVNEIIDVLNQYIMGYAGYWTVEDRQDSMDVFVAWLHGRFSKKCDDCSVILGKLKNNPDFANFEPILEETFENINKMLVHLKYDSDKIKPFLKELFIDSDKITDDLVRLDDQAFKVSEACCKKLEYLDGMTLEMVQDINKNAKQVLELLIERTKRINALNKMCYILQTNVRNFCQNIHQTNHVDDEMFGKILDMIERYPNRVETYEKILDALKTARPFYQNYSDKHTLLLKYPVYQAYLKYYPILLEMAANFVSGFSPKGDAEKKSFENLKKVIENPPDFEALSKKLDEAHQEMKK